MKHIAIVFFTLFLCLMITPLNNSYADLTDGLVAYYPFNGDATDESDNSNDGTVTGAILTTDGCGKQESAWQFDGTDDKISVPIDTSLDITSAISLAAWVYPLQLKSQIIIIKGASTSAPYKLSLAEIGNVNFYLYLDGIAKNVSITGYKVNTWTFLVGTYDGSTMKLYMNGELINSTSATGNIDVASGSMLIIGTRTQSTGNTFNGKLDNLRIYNRELNAAEIELIYENEVCRTAPGIPLLLLDGSDSQCVPDTCGGLGYECGQHSDGCGGTLNCGTCTEGYACEDGICSDIDECVLPDACPPEAPVCVNTIGSYYCESFK